MKLVSLFLFLQYHTTEMYYDQKRYLDAVTKEEVCEAANHGNVDGSGDIVKVKKYSFQTEEYFH